MAGPPLDLSLSVSQPQRGRLVSRQDQQLELTMDQYVHVQVSPVRSLCLRQCTGSPCRSSVVGADYRRQLPAAAQRHLSSNNGLYPFHVRFLALRVLSPKDLHASMLRKNLKECFFFFSVITICIPTASCRQPPAKSRAHHHDGPGTSHKNREPAIIIIFFFVIIANEASQAADPPRWTAQLLAFLCAKCRLLSLSLSLCHSLSLSLFLLLAAPAAALT